MQNNVIPRFCSTVAVMAVLALPGRADEFYVLPTKVDPAITVDGNFDDWEKVPNALTLKDKEQVTFGVHDWTGPDDLGGTVRLSWRTGGLAVAADVVDDVVLQPYTGQEIWKGDHVNVWMDLTPGTEPERTRPGKGQFHVVISPGSPGGEKPTPAQIWSYQPEGLKQDGGEAVAIKTAKGYRVEAFIPWARLGVASISLNQDANFEVAFSDADNPPGKQETLITYGRQPWVYSRLRLVPLVFGDGNGKGTPPVRGQMLLKHAEIPAGKTHEVEFDAPAIPEGKDPYLFLRTRFHFAKPAGFVARSLSLKLGDKPVEGDRLSNRSPKSTTMDGVELSYVAPDGAISVCYTPDYEAMDKDSHYALIDGAKSCEYEFNLAGLLRPGKNTLALTNHASATAEFAYTALVDDVELRIKAKLPPPPPPKPAPTGPLPLIHPQAAFPKTYGNLTQADGRIEFEVGGRKLAVESRFSTPDGKWQTGSNSFFSLKREVVQSDEWIVVRDTLANLTDQDLPLMQEHACALGKEAVKSVWLSGLQIPSGNGTRSESENPSVVAVTDKMGVGLLPLSNEFVVHVQATAQDGTIGINDRQFYLVPGGRHTVEWAVVPVGTPDLWSFVNAARRLRDANFTLKYCFAFAFHREPALEWSDKTLKDFIDNKGVNLVVQSNENVRNKDGQYARCTDWVAGPHTIYEKFQERVRTLWPDRSVKTGIYFHCFLDTTRANDEKFKADRALDAAGNHMDYGGDGAYMKIFIPQEGEGRWGQEIAKWIDTIIDKIGADGVYQDEFTRCRTPYVYNMEDPGPAGSADIDPTTHKLVRKKGSMTLISLPWRLRQVKRLLDAGRPFIINGMPITREMMALKFQAFTETGTMSNCASTILYSPIALGDHLTERKYSDAYKNILRALDFGCLYVWYPHIFHTNKAPTVYYYPFTPIELHEGYVIGQERIITKASGLFGWGDSSKFEARVFDREGVETDKITVPVVERDGRTYGEVRLPEGCMAILVRQTK